MKISDWMRNCSDLFTRALRSNHWLNNVLTLIFLVFSCSLPHFFSCPSFSRGERLWQAVRAHTHCLSLTVMQVHACLWDICQPLICERENELPRKHPLYSSISSWLDHSGFYKNLIKKDQICYGLKRGHMCAGGEVGVYVCCVKV